jgi:hypothetical protein
MMISGFIWKIFLTGFLRSISHEQADLLDKTWAGIGVCIDHEAENKRRLEGLIETIKAGIPKTSSRHNHWLQFAFRWAELNALVLGIPGLLRKDQKQIIQELRNKIDETFTSWIIKRFAGLVSLPPLPPVMLHHIPRFMSRQIAGSKQNKTALILMDGMSLDQWLVLKKSLLTQLPGIEYHENGVFSWIPTITSVSRQALFAGKPPVYFPSSINTTGRDAAQWTNFWIDQGFKKDEIIYQLKIDEKNIGQLDEMLSNPRVCTAGLVVDKIDKIMHGMELGSAGMHNQVNQWAKQGFMAALINLLLEHRFSIYLTSDHGNIEAVGCGRPSEGAIADLRGERVRIYPDELLRKKTSSKYPGALAWPPIGLPENYLPLLAPHGSAFVKEDQRLVCHGGISIEEVIVPLVKIQRRET